MTGTPESSTEQAAVATERPNMLSQIAVWVGLVAGVVFIVAAIFFSGLFIGSGGYFDRGGDDCGMYHHCHMMGPGGMIGPGQMGPGQMGPGQMGPGQQQPTTTPAVPTTPPR
jgi:hypothetical protein